MEMPCTCECGEVFDLGNGNPCNECRGVFCTDCVPEPWDCCPRCSPDETAGSDEDD